jgi:hypothetical protein
MKIVNTDWQGTPTGTSEDVMMISHEEVESSRKLFKTIKTQESIPVNTNVYFSATAVFPRRKFREMFKDNKLSTLEKADVVVMDMKDTERRMGRLYSSHYVQGANGVLERTWRVPDPSGRPTFRFLDSGPTHEKLLQEINALPDKIVVDLKNVCLPSTERLDKESYDRICRMLNATDINMRNMALRLLSAYNYDEEKETIALLLGVNWPNAQVAEMHSVEIKSMIRKLDMDFDSWRWWSHKPLSHWIKESYLHPDSEIFHELMNNALRKEWPGAPKVKMVKDE